MCYRKMKEAIEKELKPEEVELRERSEWRLTEVTEQGNDKQKYLNIEWLFIQFDNDSSNKKRI